MKEEIQSDEEENAKVENPQQIFEERFHTLMNGFGEKCESEKVELAIAIAIHPDEDHPIVFMRGDEYDIGKLTAHVLKNIKESILEQLKTE